MNILTIEQNKECPITSTEGLQDIRIKAVCGMDEIVFSYADGNEIIWNWFTDDKHCASIFEILKIRLRDNKNNA